MTVYQLHGYLDTTTIDCYLMIALEAPQLTAKFIFESSMYADTSANQKNTVSRLANIVEMDNTLYYAMTLSMDGTSCETGGITSTRKKHLKQN